MKKRTRVLRLIDPHQLECMFDVGAHFINHVIRRHAAAPPSQIAQRIAEHSFRAQSRA